MLEPGEGGREEGAEARAGGGRKMKDSGVDKNQKCQATALPKAIP